MSECIEWEGAASGRDERAVCWVRIQGKRRHVNVARAVMAGHVGWEPLEGKCVLHTCDNPKCINIEHLYIGTMADNMRDRVERNKASYTRKAYR